MNAATVAASDTGMRPLAQTPNLEFARSMLAHPAPFFCELTVDGRDLSRAIEHVSNIEYVRWLDRAAELHSDSLGFTREAMLKDDVMWFVGRHEIDYLAEAWRGDEIVIATWVRRCGRVKSWRDTLMLRPADEKVLCRASTLWVYVNLTTRRPTRIPEVMASRFAPLDAADPEPSVAT